MPILFIFALVAAGATLIALMFSCWPGGAGAPVVATTPAK